MGSGVTRRGRPSIAGAEDWQVRESRPLACCLSVSPLAVCDGVVADVGGDERRARHGNHLHGLGGTVVSMQRCLQSSSRNT